MIRDVGDIKNRKDHIEQEVFNDSKMVVNPLVIEKLKGGDHSAFDIIFHAFYSKVRAFAKFLTKDDDMADEISQVVFVNLWIYRQSVKSDKNFNAYIYTLTRNATMSALRVKSRFDYDAFDRRNSDQTISTDEELIARETELLIKMTVSKMPEKRRKVYEMSKYEYKDNNEIANELNISKKVVEKHLRLALTEIRQVLKAMMFFIYS